MKKKKAAIASSRPKGLEGANPEICDNCFILQPLFYIKAQENLLSRGGEDE